ncbi:MAG TPA: hypothetical protein VHA78_04770 [Candidatus Peribacteraceae bacterium]|nr:hypothetical protein [Candidatus Peribacteraceae bacterium]
MSQEQLPVFEVGHFEASIEQMLSGSLKYIVSCTVKDMHFVLHADATEGTHLGIIRKANVDASSVLGGGFVAWGGSEFTLRGSSVSFGAEPADVRLSFINTINDRFHDDLERYIQSCILKKEV